MAEGCAPRLRRYYGVTENDTAMIMLRGGRKEDEMPSAAERDLLCSRSDYTLLARVYRVI